VTEDKDVEYEEVENPRTGKKEQVPTGISLSFASNHANRLGSLLNIAEEKHGRDFRQQLIPQLADYMQRLLEAGLVDMIKDDPRFAALLPE
jgi:hypothetical protein